VLTSLPELLAHADSGIATWLSLSLEHPIPEMFPKEGIGTERTVFDRLERRKWGFPHHSYQRALQGRRSRRSFRISNMHRSYIRLKFQQTSISTAWLLQWGEKIKVQFQDASGNHDDHDEGWVMPNREGNNWDEAASEAFGVPMIVMDERRRVEAEPVPQLLCMPNDDQPEAEKPGSFSRFPVAIQVQLAEQRISLNVRSTEPPESVAARARVQFGVGVSFSDPRPKSWTSNQVYM
jgi:hypothetical protein